MHYVARVKQDDDRYDPDPTEGDLVQFVADVRPDGVEGGYNTYVVDGAQRSIPSPRNAPIPLPPGWRIDEEGYIRDQNGLKLAKVAQPPPGRTPLMDALYDVAALTPSVSWRAEEKWGGASVTCWRGGASVHFRATPDTVHLWTREEWREIILGSLEGRVPETATGLMIVTGE